MIDLLATEPADDQIVDALETNVAYFIAADLNHRLIPFAPRLAEIDFSARPLAALPAAVAICSIDRARGRGVLREARCALEEAGDTLGWGYACFIEGLEDLGEGQLHSSEAWWMQAATLLGNEHGVVGFTDAHLALVAYQRGELRRAVRLAELALFAAQRRRDDRVEAIAAVYLGFFSYWVGDFTRAAQAVHRATTASLRIPEPSNRYEMPLVHAIDGAIRATNGDAEIAEQCFVSSLAEADGMQNGWYRAITLAARALLTAADDPRRAVADASEALRYFDLIGERWWVAWATNSLAVAHLAMADHHAGLAACEETLAVDPLSPLERARALCTLAELHERVGNLSGALTTIREAIDAFDEAGAEYWAARAEVIAASIDLKRSEFHLRSARRRRITDPDSVAWSSMLRGRGRLRIRLLGTPLVTVDSKPVKFKTTAELEALSMLAIASDAGVALDDLSDALWPDAEWERVSHRMDNLMSSLRRALLPTTRLERSTRFVTLHVLEEECDYRNAMATANRLLAMPSLDEHSRQLAVSTLDQLSAPLLGGAIARWVIAAQARIDQRVEQLRRHLARQGTG